MLTVILLLFGYGILGFGHLTKYILIGFVFVGMGRVLVAAGHYCRQLPWQGKLALGLLV